MKQALISKSFYTVFVITMLILTAGVCAGGAIAAILPQSVSETAVHSATLGKINPDRLNAFSTSFINFFKPVFFIWVCGFFKFTFPGICAVAAYRGGIIGYFIGALTKCEGAPAALLNSVASLLPHYLLFIPLIAAASYFAIGKRTKKPSKPPYFICLALLAAGCAVSALCDAYISVFFIKLIQKI